MSLRVRMPHPPGEGFLDQLRAHLRPDVELVDDDEAPCDVLVAGRPDREALRPGLRAVVIPYAGVPARTRELLREFPAIALHNLHHNAAPTAEMAMALLLAAAKMIVPKDRALRRLDWRPRYGQSDQLILDGKTALVLGYGAIGRRVGAACRGLGMRVLAVRRGGDGAEDVYGLDALRRLLPEAHALIVCLPWTPETEGLVGAEELALLPDGAVLVNVGRGPIVQETPLYEALRSKRLRAGLDVWYRYPEGEEARARTPPGTRPFHELENVVLSPHVAGGGEGIEERRAHDLARLLNAAARGEEMPNRVDLRRGY